MPLFVFSNEHIKILITLTLTFSEGKKLKNRLKRNNHILKTSWHYYTMQFTETERQSTGTFSQQAAFSSLLFKYIFITQYSIMEWMLIMGWFGWPEHMQMCFPLVSCGLSTFMCSISFQFPSFLPSLLPCLSLRSFHTRLGNGLSWHLLFSQWRNITYLLPTLFYYIDSLTWGGGSDRDPSSSWVTMAEGDQKNKIMLSNCPYMYYHSSVLHIW